MTLWIKNIIENPVLLSIITGLITFAITWPINNWLTKRTSKKEHYAQIDKCNKQIIQMCEDYVIMSKEKKEEVFENIIKGVCYENKINLDEAYSIQNVKAILIKNFVNMRLISDNDKKVIIDKLCQQNDASGQQNSVKEVIVEKTIYINKRREKELRLITALLTSMMSVIAVVISAFITLEGKFQNNDAFPYSLDYIIGIPFCILLFCGIVLCFLKIWSMEKRRRRK